MHTRQPPLCSDAAATPPSSLAPPGARAEGKEGGSVGLCPLQWRAQQAASRSCCTRSMCQSMERTPVIIITSPSHHTIEGPSVMALQRHVHTQTHHGKKKEEVRACSHPRSLSLAAATAAAPPRGAPAAMHPVPGALQLISPREGRQGPTPQIKPPLLPSVPALPVSQSGTARCGRTA